MLSIKGLYDGKLVIPLEKIHIKPNVNVIITFLDEEFKKNVSDNIFPKKISSRKAGTLKGRIHIKDNFDESLDDFRDYME